MSNYKGSIFAKIEEKKESNYDHLAKKIEEKKLNYNFFDKINYTKIRSTCTADLLDKYYINGQKTDQGYYASDNTYKSYKEIYSILEDIENNTAHCIPKDYKYKTIDINDRNFDNCVDKNYPKYFIKNDNTNIWYRNINVKIPKHINDMISLINNGTYDIKLYLVGSSLLQAVCDVNNKFTKEYTNIYYDIYCEYDTELYKNITEVYEKINATFSKFVFDIDDNEFYCVKVINNDILTFEYKDTKIDLFGVKNVSVYDMVSNFHLSCVKLFYDGKSVCCLPSFLKTRLTNLCTYNDNLIDNGVSMNIFYKYYKRGFGFAFNKQDKKLFQSYLKKYSKH